MRTWSGLLAAVTIVVAGLSAGCTGTLAGPPSPGGTGGVSPGGGQGGGGGTSTGGGAPAQCGVVGPALAFFADNCATCHQGTRFPDLSTAGLARLVTLDSQLVPGQRLVVPGDPDASFLYRKLAHTQGSTGGVNMPIGRGAEPVPELATIAQWITEGASTECPDAPTTTVAYNPNSLDQAQLFTCADATAQRSSPSRLRRVTDDEFTKATVNAPGLSQNPLAPPGGLPYTTYASTTGMDAATLRLLMMELGPAAEIWAAGDPRAGSGRMRGLSSCCVDRASTVSCMEAPAPTQACLDGYVDTLLRRGALFRAPTADETARLRAQLVQLLADEPTSGISRHDTLSEVAQTALLMTGSFFRSELGDAATQTGTLRRLSDTELAYALANLLSDAPIGVPIPQSVNWADDPDAASFAAGRFSLIAAAAADGSIQDPAVRVSLLRHYAGGISANRPDVDTGPRDSRGDYWLSRRLMGFFREWLGYESAGTAFKDHPGQTSAFEDPGTQYSGTVTGYGALQHPPQDSHRSEPGLTMLLDDVIARVVIESDASHQDVFRALFTTRLAYLQAQPTVNDHEQANWAFGWSAHVDATDTARWMTYPDDSMRLGVLTHPAWLAAHGGNFEDDASLVHRGRWLRTELFSQPVGELSDVRGLQAMLGASASDQSARQRVRRATEPGVDPNAGPDTASGACWSCHKAMNPLGYPFEQFNHAGFERATDHGGPPDGTTVIDDLPDPALNRAYVDVADFMSALAQSRYARRGMIRHAFRYFMGRDETPADGCTLVEMEAALDRDGSFFSMLEALVSSQTFVWRDLSNTQKGTP